MVYAPSSPRDYTIYEPVIRLKGQARTVVTQRPFSSKEVQSLSLEPSALSSLQPTETQGLQSVLHKIGGMGTFVFLFARVGLQGIFWMVVTFVPACGSNYERPKINPAQTCHFQISDSNKYPSCESMRSVVLTTADAKYLFLPLCSCCSDGGVERL